MVCNTISDDVNNKIVDAVLLKTNDFLHAELSYDYHTHFSGLSVSDSDLSSGDDFTIVFSSDISLYSYILDSPRAFEKQGIGVYSHDFYIFVFLGVIFEKFMIDQISCDQIIDEIRKGSSFSLSTFDSISDKVSDYVAYRIARFLLYRLPFTG